ncbi:MAG: bifunctional phosphopantothenoylcysteine decarboxylase/phosphopantothenate--cysteine ligase CoaBC [Myxococcota bacterium]
MSTNYLQGRRIAVGVGGGIAAYKVGDLVRELRRQGATVRVAMTKAAQEFITPLTMQSLSGQPVLTDYFDTSQEAQFGHLHLARWADAFIIAPATADLIARIRLGMANDAVTTSLLAFRGPVLIAPAMNTAMWENAATQENVRALLTQSRFRMVGPGVGPLADGDVGPGRLADLPELVEAAAALGAAGPLAGKKVLVTAGPTQEPIDPVRFVSNPSTGKMGLAVAEVARARGADVTVVLGPVGDVATDGLDVVRVRTADEMLVAVMARVESVDAFVAAAAVSDWRPAIVAARKMKKGDEPEALTLVRTPDVLATASTKVHGNVKRPLLVGFAAETHDVVAYAKDKLARKRLDFIVANDVTQPGAGFGADTNRVSILGADGSQVEVAGTKRDVAARLWDIVAAHGFAR